MTKEVVVALDIGTTSAKAVMFQLNGVVIAETEEMIPTDYPEENAVEQDAEMIERLAVQALRNVIAQSPVDPTTILAVGISCAMHSLLFVDEQGDALSQALIWSDARSAKQAEALKESGLYERTGMPYHPMSPLAKLMWMRENQYDTFTKASYVMSIKEYIINKWFGKRLIDYSMAAATGLFNFKTFTWDNEAVEIAGVSITQLSDIVPPTKVLTGLNERIAQMIGIPSDLPIVIGAADGQFANLGSGAISTGDVAITAGTSGAIRQMISGCEVSPDAETFCYPFTKELSIIGGATNNGGIVLDWLKRLLAFEGTFDELIALAEHVEIGANGLVFHPYINGERAPLWNAAARGNLFGLSVTHQKEHLVRAVLEGITYNLYDINEVLERQVGKTERIYVNGGLARSPLWVHMLADVFGTEVHVSASHHNAAWGAAWTALKALGRVGSFEAIKENIPIKAVIQPDAKKHKAYQHVFAKYQALGGAITPYFISE